MSKFEVLSRLGNYQYIYGCPVFITGGNILKDTETSEIYINIKFRSISPKAIKAVIISIECYDVEKDKLAPVNKYIYQDFNVKQGDFFGEQKTILCPDSNTRSCEIKIKKIIFSDEELWENTDDSQTVSLGLQTRLSDWSMTNLKKVLYDELKAAGYSRDNVVYIPNKFDNCWVCTCGMINFYGGDCSCGMTYDNAFKLFNEKYLEEQLSAFEEKNRKKAEEEAKRRRAMQEQEIEEKRKIDEVRRKLQEEDIERERKKKTQMLILWAIVIAIILAIVISFALLGDYDENQETVLFDAESSSNIINDTVTEIKTTAISKDMTNPTSSSSNDFDFTLFDGEITLTKYNGKDNVVVIPSEINNYPVINIGESCFENNTTIEEVIIPEGILYILEHSFCGCVNLKDISFPTTLYFIDCSALYQVPWFDNQAKPVIINDILYDYGYAKGNIVIPDNVTYINAYAFMACTELTSVTLSDNCKVIDNGAFSECINLKNVRFPKSEIIIYDNAFYNCSVLDNIVIPNGSTIGSLAFGNCISLAHVSMGTDISQENYSFYNTIYESVLFAVNE